MYQKSYDALQQVAGGLKTLADILHGEDEADGLEAAIAELTFKVEQVIKIEAEAEAENDGDEECDGACASCEDRCPVSHYPDSLHAAIEIGQHRIEIHDIDDGNGRST